MVDFVKMLLEKKFDPDRILCWINQIFTRKLRFEKYFNP